MAIVAIAPAVILVATSFTGFGKLKNLDVFDVVRSSGIARRTDQEAEVVVVDGGTLLPANLSTAATKDGSSCTIAP
jgi:hypothetical protein